MKAGWEVKPLGEVCENLDKLRVPITKGKREPGEVPYFGASGVVDHVADYIFDEPLLLVSEDGANLLARTYPIAFSIAGKTWVNNHAHVLRFSEAHTRVYVENYLNSISLEPFVSGMAQPKLNQKKLSEIPIPIPPLEEQKRIVAVLDAAFEGLTRAKENAETNLQNARELFENTELGLFDKHTRNITKTKLGDFADFRNGLNFSKSSTGQTIKIVGVRDFQDYFWMPLEQLKSVNIEGQLAEQDMIAEGDILVVRSNGNKELIGRVMLADAINEPTSFSGFTIRIRLNSNQVTPEYVCYFMKTKAMRKHFTAGGDGANISNLNQTLLSNLAIKVPSTEVQRIVVEEAKALRASFDGLLAKYRTKLTDIADLRQSLLQKAFAGELT